ncbi:MAG: DUF6266 family protein [Bacteroidales bacterium]
MAQSTTGINGIFSGRIGNVVFYEMNGKQVARQLPSGKMPAATGPKKVAQENFGRVIRIMKGIRQYVNTGFKDVETRGSAFRQAVSVNLKRLGASSHPDSLEWLLPTMGTRAGAHDITMQQADQMATVSWGAPHEDKPYLNRDLVMLLAINATTLENTGDLSATRSQQQCTFRMPRAKEGEKVLVFLSFYDPMAAATRKNSDNVSEAQLVIP